MSEKVPLEGGGVKGAPTRDENIDRRYIAKAIIQLFSQYRKISKWSPQFRDIDNFFNVLL